MAGAQPMVSYTAGSMNSLLDKLIKLKNPPPVIHGLKQDLVNLGKGFFYKVSGRREMNLQVEAWMKLVRELVFDIEDWIDQKPAMTDMGGLEEDIKSFKARIEHARELCVRYNLVTEVPTDHYDPFAVVPGQIAVDSPLPLERNTGLVGVNEPTNELVEQLTNKQEKMLKVVSIYGMEGLGKTTLAKEIYTKLQGEFECRAFVSLGRRPLSMRDTLMEILSQVKPSQKKMLKPKTSTLWGGRSTPQQDLQKIISKLSKYLATKRYFILVDGIWSTRAWRIINCALPNENRGSRVLTTTCISDVAECCSIRPSDVYWMKALSEKNCKSLYLQLIRQEEVPADYDEVTKIILEMYYDEVTNNMLEMCGGMPLAVIVTAGLSGMKSEELVELEKMFGKSVNLSSLEQYSTSEGMTKILNMCYAALSLPLKSCLLYLSVFPEDHTIKKDRLIRLWVAEGFIPRKHKETRDEETRGEKIRDEETITSEETRDGKRRGEETITSEETMTSEETRDGTRGGEETTRVGEETRDEESLWETGEGYFNELIMRRLIQPVVDDDGQAIGCTVHCVIHDFIKSLSSKGNFVTVSADLSSGGSKDTVRRFSLDCCKEEDDDGTLASISVHLSRVRSVTVLGGIEGRGGRSALTASGKIKGTPLLPSFRLMRVLDLEDTENLGSHHLEGIGGLVLLRYLGVAGTDIDKLPEEIGELEHLETLDVRQTTKLSNLPASIGKQKSLVHLLIDPTVKLPKEILEMQELEEVSTIGVDVSRSVDQVEELLRKSKRLRVLGIRLDGSRLSDNKCARHLRGLLEQVVRCTKLRSLSLDCLNGDLLGLLLESPPFDQLRRFELRISSPIPGRAAVYMASLVNLTHVEVGIIQLEDGLVRVLGQLPNLVCLKLVSSGVINSRSKESRNRRCTVYAGGFRRLTVFSLKFQFGGTELEFRVGAMLEVQRLSLSFSARETLSLYGNFNFGIQYLSSLRQVHATIDCKSAMPSEVNNAQDAIKAQLAYRQLACISSQVTLVNQELMLADHKANKTTLKLKDANRTRG